MVLLYRKYGNDTIRITNIFLKMMGVRTSLPVMKDFFNNHIYKDTLFCIQDFISDKGLHTKAIRYNKPDIEKLPTPFIVTLNSGSGNQDRFAIVSEISETKVKILDLVNSKWRHVDKPIFIDQWTKVALLAEDGRSKVVKQAAQQSGYDIPYVVMQFSILLMIILLLFRFSVTNVLVYLIGVLNIIGMIISIYLVKLDFGYNNRISNNFCNISGKFSCNEILVSKGASIFNIKWAIIGLSYFVANFIMSLFIFLFLKEYETGLFAINCFPLLFAGYSIFYQWIIEKKWCLLCLLVQGLLVGQFFILLFNTRISFSQAGKENMIDAFLVIMLIHLVSLYIINFVLVKRYRFIESTKIKFLTYKKALLTTNSFDHFAFAEQRMEAPELGIFIGNPKASNSILLISTPSCRFCSDSMLDLLSLIRGSSNICVQVIFRCYSSGAEDDKEVINYFLNLHKQEAPVTLCDALCYWALKKPTPYNLINTFPLKGTIADCKADIESMASWCAVQNIDNVPTLFVNGRPLPYIYDIKDLKFALK